VSDRPPGLAFRLVWLHAGLAGFGVSLALLVKARLGLDPWDVLNQGIARHLGIQIGWVVDAVGVLVLLTWIPLRQRPGVGTVCNVVLVGLVVNVALQILPGPAALLPRLGMIAAAVLLNAVSTGCYIGAGLGPGPRDGLMIGIVSRGHSLRVVRTAIELSVLVAGLALGGSAGIGTVVYALAIGPLTHLFLPHLTLGPARPAGDSPAAGRGSSQPEESHATADVRSERIHLGRSRRRSGRPGPGGGRPRIRLRVRLGSSVGKSADL
jgi:uncharacterized membrane protein YczE